MSTLIIDQEDVRGLLTMDECIRAVRDALVELAAGQAVLPLRPVMWLPENVGALGMMPGYLASIDTIGIKTITVFPGNAGTPYDSHQGTVMLFDGRFGRLRAIVDATEITAIRTAAASAVATDALARPQSSVLAILGSGVQARSHLQAMPAVRPIEQVRIWSRNPDNARRLVESSSAQEMDVTAAATIPEAVKGADIICTTTAATQPVLRGSLLEPGMHINAVGASVPTARELDGAAVASARLVVDRRESAHHEAGDFLLARDEGLVDDDHIVAELGEVLIGSAAGRRSDEDITLFKSLGLAVEDIAAADLVVRKAVESGAGTSLDLGGVRHA